MTTINKENKSGPRVYIYKKSHLQFAVCRLAGLPHSPEDEWAQPTQCQGEVETVGFEPWPCWRFTSVFECIAKVGNKYTWNKLLTSQVRVAQWILMTPKGTGVPGSIPRRSGEFESYEDRHFLLPKTMKLVLVLCTSSTYILWCFFLWLMATRRWHVFIGH